MASRISAPEGSVHPATREDWRAWLEANHARREGVWLVMTKARASAIRVTYDEAVEEALCFGWIDSRPNSLDDDRSLLWMAPRKPGTGWSRLNKERIARLEAAGRMAPAGLAKVAAAKADGSWPALDAVEALEVPADLKEAMDAVSGAAVAFDAFPRSVKRGILEWIQSAKRPETRAARVRETAEKAGRNERANQWRPERRG